jgi:hypothetical protein
MSTDGEYFYDEHTLYIENNDCTADQVRAIMRQVFDQIATLDSVAPSPDDVTYIRKIDERKNRSYIHVFDSRAFYRIIGNNADGTPHVVSKFVESASSAEEKKEYWQAEVTSWADDADREAQVIGKTEHVKEPLIKVAGFVFVDESQSLRWRDLVKSGQIAVMRARVNRIFDDKVPNVLLLKGFPSDVTVATVRRLVSFYSHSTAKSERDKDQLLYPIVQQRNNMFVVTFDPNTTDGYFAQVMINGSKLARGAMISAQYGNKR